MSGSTTENATSPLIVGTSFNKKASDGYGNGAPRKNNVDRPADIAAGQAARDVIKRMEELAAKREAAKKVEPVQDKPAAEL